MKIIVTTLEELDTARFFRLSVVCPTSRAWNKPKPAAFIMNLSGDIILKLIRRGLYIYEKGTIYDDIGVKLNDIVTKLLRNATLT